MSILLIWALTCIGELQHAVRTYYNLIRNLPAVASNKDMLQKGDDKMVVQGVSVCFKVVIVSCVIIPQVAIALVLLWLGSRWLTATTDFTDLLLNAVALEFIFCLKDLIYKTVISARSKKDVE